MHKALPLSGGGGLATGNRQGTSQSAGRAKRLRKGISSSQSGNSKSFSKGFSTKYSVFNWKTTVDFLRGASLAKAGTDYTKAWTLDIVKNVRMLP